MATELERIEIFITPYRLSDGSEVHNVQVGDLVIPASSESDAQALAIELFEVLRNRTPLAPGAGGGVYSLPTRRAS